jgi:hypothetical protein
VIVLVGCSATKLDVPAPAKDLYEGPIFKMVRRLVEHPSAKRPTAWGILSAKHGLLAPDGVIEPYDLSASSFDYSERQDWCDAVVRDVVATWGARTVYRVYAGSAYLGAAWATLPFVKRVFSEWGRIHQATRTTRFGIGHIRRNLIRELARLDATSPAPPDGAVMVAPDLDEKTHRMSNQLTWLF